MNYMIAEAFLDTNVLLYALSKVPAEAAKARAANALVEKFDFGVSAQVCQEFYVAATGKLAKTIDRQTALQFLQLLMQRPVVPTTPALISTAIQIQQRCQISYWDAAVIAAAESLQVKILYTEDLNHGQIYGTVQVQNPFLSVGASSV
jgi:predicted nucleic acid-binding protein